MAKMRITKILVQVYEHCSCLSRWPHDNFHSKKLRIADPSNTAASHPADRSTRSHPNLTALR